MVLSVFTLVLGLAACTGCAIELFKKRLIRWVENQPWRSRMIPLQQNMMLNFGYSRSTTCDEAVVIDCYCFTIAICSHHLLMSIALAPVALLGWDAAGSRGQFLFCAGALGDLAFTLYDALQITLRTFFPNTFRCLGVQLPVKFFVVMVCLHHALSLMLTVPMLLYYSSMSALHAIMCSLLFAGGTCYLLGCYKFTLDTQNSQWDFLQYKAIVLVQFMTIWLTRACVWVSQSVAAMIVFYTEGDAPFLCVGLMGGVLMTFFNMLMLIDSTKAAIKWLPKQMPKQSICPKVGCAEREFKPSSKPANEILRRVQLASATLAE